MTASEFLRPRLCGARFDGATIPLEVLADLAVLEEMVVEVAKWRFRQDHPDRKRAPRNFSAGVELKLTKVEDGSAIAVIALTLAAPPAPLFPDEVPRYFELARESIVASVWAADQKEDVLRHLPAKCLAYFDRLGRGLRAGEALELPRGDGLPPARLTPESRQRLLAAADMTEVTQEARVRGAVVELDDERGTFQLQLVDGRRLSGPVPVQFRDSLLEALSERRSGARLMVQGVGSFDRRGKLLRMTSIERLTALDALDVPARIDELRLLKDGWLDGQGAAPTSAGLSWFSQAFDERFPDGLSLPYLYPTEGGGLRAEWSAKGREMSLDVDVVSHGAHWHSWQRDTDVEESERLDLDTEQAWARLATLVAGTGEAHP